MEEFLSQVYFDNSVKNYAYALAALIFALLLRRFVARWVVGAAYRILRPWFPEAKREDFDALLLSPVRMLMLLVVIPLIVGWMRFPSVLDFEYLSFSFKTIVIVFYKLCMYLAIAWLVFRSIDFISAILLARSSQTKNNSDDQAVMFLKEVLKLSVIILGILLILSNIFKFDVTAVLAGAGIAGLAVALAARETLENMLASVTIFLERPFTVGDYVEVEGLGGLVEKVGFRSTRLRTMEKTFVTLPNKKMIDGALDNVSLRTMRRVNTNIGLTYGTSAETMQLVIADIRSYIEAKADTSGETTVVFNSFGDSSLNIYIQYYLQNENWPEFMRSQEAVNFKIMQIVQAHDTDFAFPTQTLHLNQEA